MQLANDIDPLDEEKQELEALVECLNKPCMRYKMDKCLEDKTIYPMILCIQWVQQN